MIPVPRFVGAVRRTWWKHRVRRELARVGGVPPAVGPFDLDAVDARRTHLAGRDQERGLIVKVAQQGPAGASFRRAVANRSRVASLCPGLGQPGVLWMAPDRSVLVEELVDGRHYDRVSDVSPAERASLVDGLVSLYRSGGVVRRPAWSSYEGVRASLRDVLAENGLDLESFPFQELDDRARRLLPPPLEVARTELAHGDLVLWLNLIWTAEGRPVFLDWEDAGSANLLYDVVTLLTFEGFRYPGPSAFQGLRELAAGRGPFARVLGGAGAAAAGQDGSSLAGEDAHVFLACVELILNRARKKAYSRIGALKRYLAMIDDVFGH